MKLQHLVWLVLLLGAGQAQPADIIWDNGRADGRNGYLCQRGGDTLWDTWIADDFILERPARITRALSDFYIYPVNATEHWRRGRDADDVALRASH